MRYTPLPRGAVSVYSGTRRLGVVVPLYRHGQPVAYLASRADTEERARFPIKRPSPRTGKPSLSPVRAYRAAVAFAARAGKVRRGLSWE